MEDKQLEELEKIFSSVMAELSEMIDNLREVDNQLDPMVSTILASFVCQIVIENYGKTEKAHEVLNKIMGLAWKSNIKED